MDNLNPEIDTWMQYQGSHTFIKVIREVDWYEDIVICESDETDEEIDQEFWQDLEDNSDELMIVMLNNYELCTKCNDDVNVILIFDEIEAFKKHKIYISEFIAQNWFCLEYETKRKTLESDKYGSFILIPENSQMKIKVLLLSSSDKLCLKCLKSLGVKVNNKVKRKLWPINLAHFG